VPDQTFNNLPTDIQVNPPSIQTRHNPASPMITRSQRANPASPMITRSKTRIIKPNPKYALISSIFSASIPREPHNTRAALSHPCWKAAMDEELEALHKNQTWTTHLRHACNWFKTGIQTKAQTRWFIRSP